MSKWTIFDKKKKKSFPSAGPRVTVFRCPHSSPLNFPGGVKRVGEAPLKGMPGLLSARVPLIALSRKHNLRRQRVLFCTCGGYQELSGQKVVNARPGITVNKRKGSGCDSASRFNAHLPDHSASDLYAHSDVGLIAFDSDSHVLAQLDFKRCDIPYCSVRLIST